LYREQDVVRDVTVTALRMQDWRWKSVSNTIYKRVEKHIHYFFVFWSLL